MVTMTPAATPTNRIEICELAALALKTIAGMVLDTTPMIVRMAVDVFASKGGNPWR